MFQSLVIAQFGQWQTTYAHSMPLIFISVGLDFNKNRYFSCYILFQVNCPYIIQNSFVFLELICGKLESNFLLFFFFWMNDRSIVENGAHENKLTKSEHKIKIVHSSFCAFWIFNSNARKSVACLFLIGKSSAHSDRL